jgi:hypothetical protein
VSRLLVWLLPLGFFISENNYFGWNRYPQSSEELICDGIVLLLVVLCGIYLQLKKESER